jgi:2'-5' RNA ligase
VPFAVHLYFDAPSEEVIWVIWNKLAESGVAPYMAASGARPHVSLAIYETVVLPEMERRLQDWANSNGPFDFVFSHLGAFCAPKPVVFVAPTTTTPLLNLHEALHQTLAGLGSDPWAHYLPGSWVPHCTLAFDIELAALPEAMAVAKELSLPLKGQMTGIGLIETRPVKELFTFSY